MKERKRKGREREREREIVRDIKKLKNRIKQTNREMKKLGGKQRSRNINIQISNKPETSDSGKSSMD